MKTLNTHLLKFSLFAAVLAFTVTFTSCSKDDDPDSGSSVNIKVVNAAENSSSQDFYIEGAKLTTVSQNSASNYITTTNSGSNKNVEFRTSGSSEVYASQKVDLEKNHNYTFFLTGTGNSASIKVTDDNLTPPSSGKAKVRFIHLSSAASADVDIYTTDGTNSVKLATVSRDKVSDFTEVNPSLGIGIIAAGDTNLAHLQALSSVSLSANKIYTILISGSTSVSAMAITHN